MIKVFNAVMNRIVRAATLYRKSKIYQRYAKVREEYNDLRLNRELVGIDRLGNKYYQYYSQHGLPIRREIDFIDKTSYEMKDLAFYHWLLKRQEAPPTKEELDQYYREEEERKAKALEWDKQERLIMTQVYQQKYPYMKQEEYNRRLPPLPEEHLKEIMQIINKNKENLQLEQQSQELQQGSSYQNIEQQQEFEPKAWQPKTENIKRRRQG